jgi:hypothetical protein
MDVKHPDHACHSLPILPILFATALAVPAAHPGASIYNLEAPFPPVNNTATPCNTRLDERHES